MITRACAARASLTGRIANVRAAKAGTRSTYTGAAESSTMSSELPRQNKLHVNTAAGHCAFDPLPREVASYHEHSLCLEACSICQTNRHPSYARFPRIQTM